MPLVGNLFTDKLPLIVEESVVYILFNLVGLPGVGCRVLMPYPLPVSYHLVPNLDNLIKPRLFLADSYLNLLQRSNGIQSLEQFIIELI